MVDGAIRLKTDGPVTGGIICTPGIHVSTFCGWIGNPKKQAAAYQGRDEGVLRCFWRAADETASWAKKSRQPGLRNTIVSKRPMFLKPLAALLADRAIEPSPSSVPCHAWIRHSARAPRFPSPPHLQTFIITEIERHDFIKRRVVHAENTGRVERRKVSVQEHIKLLRLMESGAPADEIEAYARQHKENALHYRHELK